MTNTELPDEENWLYTPPIDNTLLCLKMAKAISLGESTAFHIAVCNDARQREELMRQVEEFLPSQHAQRLRVPASEDNLIKYMRRSLESPPPQAIFVYGLEDWIFGNANHRANTFLLNLNATRDGFRLDYQSSLVLWVPEYILDTLMEAAPDFLSTVSGQFVFSELMSLQQQALAGIIEENDTGIAEELNNLAISYYSQGRYSEAVPLLETALTMRRKTLPEGHSDIAESLNDLAIIYRRQGRYAEAEPLYQEALAIRCNALPENHPDIAESLNNLGLLYRIQERHEEAKSLLKRALTMRRKTLPEGHSDIARSLSNLAILYHHQERYSEAEPLFEEALEIFRKALGDNHPHTKLVAENLRLFRQQANTS